MAYYTTFPIWNASGKKNEILDASGVSIGFIQRAYKNTLDKPIHYSPIPISFLETVNIDGENCGNQLKIREQSFKSNLTKLKWDVFLNQGADSENKFLLLDKTKISTNPRMIYFKNNREYVFKKDLLNPLCKISIGDESCATIKVEKKVPLTVKTVMNRDDLTIVELLGIYYVICLAY